MSAGWIPAWHVNQLHRLGLDGKPAGSWPALWGKDYNGLNCAYAAGAIAARFATRGSWEPSPNALRQLAGDREGGASIGDVARALIASRKIPAARIVIPAGGLTWGEITAQRGRGKLVVLPTDYELIPDAKSCQPTFDEDHMLALPPVDPDASGLIVACDPLCDAPRRYLPDVIRRSARAFADAHGHAHLPALVIGQGPAPRPPSVDPRDARIAELETALDEARDRIDALEGRMAAIADLALA